MSHPNLDNKTYLGDGLYVGEKYGQVWLYAHNGLSVLNEVCLEPEVIQEFFKYLERIRGLEIKVTKRAVVPSDRCGCDGASDPENYGEMSYSECAMHKAQREQKS